ncbi:S9 family peptidase [Corallococcus carmarthensis]|uniref:Acyl-peptide hydrolase n=1 Tax=Corallococcus carmarthensis TaxID=2316728 RepID=A0A3A8KTP9_9BACT|nr:S9 family peptidase [Corallococcus carmarthensis]NOK15555.1 S9 family peptidase [Corallococcus carmarthensis]RKH07631.1 S9 family peptidase [Corallococcus carmarthensis]
MHAWKSLSRLLAPTLLLPLLGAAPPAATPAPKPAPDVRAVAGGPASRPFKQYTVEQFMGSTEVMAPVFTSDGKQLLFSSNASGIFNVHSVPVGGGKATALTRSKTDSIRVVGAFPRDSRFLFERDQGGNEQTHVYVRTPDGKEKDLTPMKEGVAGFLGFSHDDSAFYITTNERDPGAMDVYRHDAKTYARTLLFQNDKGLGVAAVAPDESWVALEEAVSTSDGNVWRYDVATKTLKNLTPHTGAARYQVGDIHPVTGELYVITDDGSEFTRVVRPAKEAGKWEDVEKADWDIFSTTFSRSGAFRVSILNVDAGFEVHLHDVKAGTRVPLTQFPAGMISDAIFSRDERQLAVLMETDRASANLYVQDLATKKTTRVTDTMTRELAPEDLVDAQVVRFKSFDGMEIPNLLYKPRQATAEHKAPALVFVHGGPGGQTSRGYNNFVQYLVNQGYVVLGINNRGSAGYGKAFLKADDQKHGKEPLRDCVEARKYLASLPYVDGSHVGIIGASYGGYMVLAALAFHPDAFDVGVDVFGPSNWLRTLKGMPPQWGAFRQAMFQEMGDPEKQEAMLKEISPLFHADKIQKPLLVVQGANDPRVLQSESDDIVAAVKKNGVPVEYLLLPDEGHGFKKKKNEALVDRRALEFFNRYLKPATAPAPKP